MAAPRLPYQPPPWLTSERIAVAAAALPIFGGWVPPLPFRPPESVVGYMSAVAASVCAGVVVHVALRAADLRRALVRVAVGVGLMGVLMHDLGEVAFYLAGPVSLLMGVVLAVLVAIVVNRRQRPSHDAPIRMLRDAGLWLAATSLYVLPQQSVFVPGIAAGAVLVGVALAWFWLRMRFVAQLRAAAARARAAAPPLVTHEGAQPYLDEGVLPYRLGRKDAAYELLVWNPPPSDSAVYRDTSQPVAMALVPIPDQVRKTER